MIVGLDHIGVAVNKLNDVLPVYERVLGLNLEGVRESKEQKIRAALFAVGGTHVELLEPLDKESTIAKFLEKRGQSIHHIAFIVDNIEETLRQLKEKGAVLIDEKPRVGIEGGKIAFMHPKSTGNVLVELCER